MEDPTSSLGRTRRTCTVPQMILHAVNGFYVLCAIVLIIVAALARVGSIVTSINILEGIVATGCLLLFIALLGFVGTYLHSQAMLFLYMVCLMVLFIIQFSISTAALSVSSAQQHSMLSEAWCRFGDERIAQFEENARCCGFYSVESPATPSCLQRNTTSCPAICDAGCAGCYDGLKDEISGLLVNTGSVGLAFAFTEFIGVWAAWNLRSQKNTPVKYREFL